tara:strand:- start:1934 stop:4501 length:2568 start_codon:yes stop_codon:yes gene_type:complete
MDKDPLAKEGMRIRMVHMEDQRPVDEGLEGTISHIDDIGTIHVKWDDGGTLGVIPGIDKYELLPPSDEQIDMDSFTELFDEGSDFKVSQATKKNKMGKNTALNFKRELSKTRPKVRDIKVEAEEIKGGEAEGLTVQDIAKKHKVPIGDIRKEIKLGAKIEMEHTDSKAKAKEIAMDHITEYPDYYSNKKYGIKASEEGLEKDLEETSTAGGVSTGAFIEPLGGKKETIIKKPFAKQVGKEVVGKKSISNPIGKIYTVVKKSESKIINKKDLIRELSSSSSSKLRDEGGSFDGDAWVGDKHGWERKDELAWEGGEISDILAKMDINWNDSDLTLTDKQTDKINEAKTILKEIYVDPTPISVLLTMYIGSRLAGAKSKEVPQYLAELGGDLMIGFVKFMNKFGYSVDTDILKTKWDGLLKKALRKYYKEGGVLYPMLDDAEKRAKKRNKKSDPEVLDDIDLNEGWLFKTKEDKMVLNILKRVKQNFPTDITIGDTRYKSAPMEGEDIRFSLPGIKQDARIRVTYGYNAYGDAYAYIEVNSTRLKSSKWAIRKLYDYLYDILEERYDKESLNQIQSDLTDPNFAQDVFDMLGDEDVVNEGKKKKTKEEDIEEATTHASVWGANGPPVVPIFGAKGKDHVPSRKPIFKGGKIIQKINNSGVLTEHTEVEDSPIPGVTSAQFRDELMGVWGLRNVEFIKKGTYSTDSKEEYVLNNEGFINTPNEDRPKITTLNGKTIMTWKMPQYDLFQEVNKIKWVKGGKYVKIKDKCAKYNNQPWCSQGAIDNPLEFSDTVFENIEEVSKATGLSEEKILDRIKAKLKGVTPEQMEYNKEHGLPIWWAGSKEGFYEKMEPRKNYTGSN